MTGKQFSREYGSLYDRGRADSYFNRGPNPHWCPNGTHRPERITDLTEEEKAEYLAGYRANEASGDHKEWD